MVNNADAEIILRLILEQEEVQNTVGVIYLVGLSLLEQVYTEKDMLYSTATIMIYVTVTLST